MSLYDELRSDDGMTRLRAVEKAGQLGDPTYVDVLLDLALTDPTGSWPATGNAAAQAVKELLEPTDGIDPRIRAAVCDLSHDDGRVATLLGHLGGRYEPLRRELETSDEARLRRRARLPAAADAPGAAAAIASRILVDGHDDSLYELVGHEHLLTHAPELRATLEHLRRHTPHGALYTRLGIVLDAPPVASQPVADPAAGLDAAQLERLRREVLRWAAGALEPVASDDEVRALTADPGDLRAALDAGVRVAVETARREPEGADGTVVDPDRAADLTRLAQLFTARQIRTGVEPLPPRPLRPILLCGPDALTVGLNAGLPTLPLALRRPRTVTADHRPRHAVWRIPCPACDASVRVDGDLEWLYRDDDRTVEWEDGFSGYLEGTCAGCGGHRRFEARLSLAVSRFNQSAAELTWDAVEERHGLG